MNAKISRQSRTALLVALGLAAVVLMGCLMLRFMMEAKFDFRFPY